MPDRVTWGNAGRYPRHPGTLGVPQARRVSRIRASVLALAVALGTGSCQSGDLGAGPDLGNPASPAFTAIISNAVRGGASLGHPSTAAEGEVAYVSLPPGTLALGESARILNRRSGTVVQTLVINGGFDPVSVVARAGDTLRVEVRLVGASDLVTAEFEVPPGRPPVIVRTNPPPRKRDVPLNATMVVVFSEPINPATLTPLALQLVGDDGPVSGTIHIVAGYPWMVEFTPATLLKAEASYELVVTKAIRDLDGESLAAEDRVPFTTGTATSSELSARLRVVHVDDEWSQLRVVMAGREVATLDYQKVSHYLVLDPGSHHVEVMSPGGGRVESRESEFVAGVDYTLLPCCALFPDMGTLLTYDRSAPVPGRTKLRVANYARVPSVNVYVTAPGTDLATETPTFMIQGLDASDYLELPAGQYQVRVTPWNTKTVVVDSGILTLGDGQVRTAIALDTRGGGAGSLLVLSDLK